MTRGHGTPCPYEHLIELGFVLNCILTVRVIEIFVPA
jgi:hypothetical protein